MEGGDSVNSGESAGALAVPVSEAWIGAGVVAALLPAVADLSWSGALAWSAALVVGAAVANASPLRWIAVAWASAAVVPGVNAMAIVAAGLLAGRWPNLLVAAVAGPPIALFVPLQFRTAGVLLLGCAVAIVALGRPRDRV